MMKALFIDNYKANAIIESRVDSFIDWEIHGRLGDGIIAPITVIKSPDDKSVLLTYDRNPETTNPKSKIAVHEDDERAGLWFGDILKKETQEVFKEMGGGTVLYVDQAKSNPKTIDIFLQKMHAAGRLDQASLETLKPMLSDSQVVAYENIIPTYEDIERAKAEAMANSEYATYVYTVDENGNEIKKDEAKPAEESVEPSDDNAFDAAMHSEIGSEDPETIDFNPEDEGVPADPNATSSDNTEENPLPDENSEDVIEDPEIGPEYNLNPEGLRKDYNPEDIPEEAPEINPDYEKASNDEMSEYADDTTPIQGVSTEPENIESNEDGTPKIAVHEINGTTVLDPKYQGILDGINTYLEKYDMTIDEFMDSVFKLKFILNQISEGKVPAETSADIEESPETLDDSTPEANLTENPETPSENMTEVSNPVQNLLNSVADEMKNTENTEDNTTQVDETSNVNTEVSENPNPEENNTEETVSTESINPEKELIDQMMKISNNDNEFFNNMLQYKDRLSMETINELVTTKMYDKILTGMTVNNMVDVRDARARKLGLV